MFCQFFCAALAIVLAPKLGGGGLHQLKFLFWGAADRPRKLINDHYISLFNALHFGLFSYSYTLSVTVLSLWVAPLKNAPQLV